MLVDVQHEPRRLRYRLIGTRVVAANAEDRTGRFLDDVDFIKNNPSVNKHYNSVVDNAEPFLSLEPFFNRSNSLIYQAKRLLQPLFSDDKTVDMLLTYFYFTTGPYANR
jgi:hypothetical protein